MSSRLNYAANPLRSRVSIYSILVFYVVLLGLTWGLDRGHFTQGVDQLLHDVWVRASQRAAPDDVVIVGIDPQSLEQLGRWPWPRDLQANLFSKLARSGVKAVALDLLYTEPDNYPANDLSLANAIGRLPLAVLPVLTEGRNPYAEYAEKLPIPGITQHADNIGHIFTPLDSDGLVRRVHLKSGFRAAHWSTLGLALAEVLDAAPEDLPGRRLPLSAARNQWIEDYQVLIPFYGSAGTFTQVSVADVLTDRLAENFLQDKIVLVGMTSTGLGDVLPTAVSAEDKPMPGVEIHANVFSALRDGALVTELGSNLNYALASLLLLAIVLLYSQLPPLWGLISAITLALVPIVISFILYRYFHYWYAPLTASIPLVVSYLLWSWHRLEFAADFMRRETGKLIEEISPSNMGDNHQLAAFFESASELLPIEGWSFSAGGSSFEGGEELRPPSAELRTGHWIQANQIYRKRYATRGRLQISFKLTDPTLAPQFMDYVDSLSRVKERQVRSRLTGSIERLQGHTYELKHQLDRLRQLKSLSDSIIAGSPAGLVVWNAAGEAVTHNSLAGTMLPDMDFNSVSLLAFLRSIGVDPEGRDQEKISALLFHAIPWQLNRVKDDSEVVINLNATGATLSERLVSASIVDVSDIRRSERSRAELIDFLSHDLRSPLISALYMLDDEDRGTTEEQAVRTAKIEGNINLTLKMIEDLLNIARADNLSSDAFTPTLFDSIVDNAVDRLSPQARNADIALNVETLDDDLWLDGDAGLLERALVNVISNAIKYSPAESTVTIQTRREHEELVLSVQDQGIGIEPDMMKNLFQRFKRDVKAAGKIDGIGLGLALVARVVNQHRGSVRAFSPAQGTQIEIRLPLNLDLLDDSDAELSRSA